MSRRFIGGTEAQWIAQEFGKVTEETASDRYGQYLRNGTSLDEMEADAGDASREVARLIKEKFNLPG